MYYIILCIILYIMNNYSSTINNRLEKMVSSPLKNVGSNINNNFNKYVNTPIKDIGSKINSKALYNSDSNINYNSTSNYDNNNNDYGYGYGYEDTGSSSGFFKKILFWVAFILLLAFLGFNIFTYLAQGTDIVASLLAPFTYIIAYFTGETAKTTLKHTSQGTQTIVNESSNFLQIFLKFITDLFNNTLVFVTTNTTSAIDYLQSNIKKDKTIDVKPQKQINNPTTKPLESQAQTKEETEEETETNDAIDSTILKEDRKVENRVQSVSDDIKKLIIKKESREPEPVQSESQQHGYCYIGKINNSRYCAKVLSKDNCMSGDIFPTMAVCINPNLRT